MSYTIPPPEKQRSGGGKGQKIKLPAELVRQLLSGVGTDGTFPKFENWKSKQLGTGMKRRKIGSSKIEGSYWVPQNITQLVDVPGEILGEILGFYSDDPKKILRNLGTTVTPDRSYEDIKKYVYYSDHTIRKLWHKIEWDKKLFDKFKKHTQKLFNPEDKRHSPYNYVYRFKFKDKLYFKQEAAKFVNIEILWAEELGISDLGPLAKLTKLVELYLWGNQIVDVNPLAKLTKLVELYLSDNKIEDLSPLAGLKNLKELYLSGNKIEDLSPLAGLTNLVRLHLSHNQIVKVDALAGLTKLRTLGLGNNKIGDVSPLAGLTKLKELHLWENQIDDVSPLARLTNLVELDLERNLIVDFTPLDGLRTINTDIYQ